MRREDPIESHVHVVQGVFPEVEVVLQFRGPQEWSIPTWRVFGHGCLPLGIDGRFIHPLASSLEGYVGLEIADRVPIRPVEEAVVVPTAIDKRLLHLRPYGSMVFDVLW